MGLCYVDVINCATGIHEYIYYITDITNDDIYIYIYLFIWDINMFPFSQVTQHGLWVCWFGGCQNLENIGMKLDVYPTC